MANSSSAVGERRASVSERRLARRASSKLYPVVGERSERADSSRVIRPESLARVFANHKDLARALKRWAPKGCRLEGMILDTKGTRSFRCNAARACDHFRELERACRGGGAC